MKSVIFGLLVAAGLAGTASSAQAYYPPYYGGGYRPSYYQPSYGYGSGYIVQPHRGHYHVYPNYSPYSQYHSGYYNGPVYAQPSPYYYGRQNSIGIYGPRVGVRIGY